MSRSPAFLDRLNLGALLRLAANSAGEELGAAALSRAVGELLEVEIEHRLTVGTVSTGHATVSPLAFAGMGGGATLGQSDRVADAAEHYRGANAWRGLALSLLEALGERHRRAALVAAFLVRPTQAAQRSPRMMTIGEACEPERLAGIYQRLGWPPQSLPTFATPGTLENNATEARKRLREALAAKLAAAVTDHRDPGSPCHE